MPEEIALVLRGLLHEATHVSSLGLARREDAELVLVARDFDVFVTLDLHRQDAEWLAVNREIAGAGIKVLRIRLPRQPQAGELHLLVARQLIWRMEQWLLEFARGAGLITIGPPISRVSVRTPEQVTDLLERRTRGDMKPGTSM